MGQGESKLWDGYLILLTPAVAPSELAQLEAVRYDTGRVRKFVATGNELKLHGSVTRILRPLVPITEEIMAPSPASVLDLLPALLARNQIPLEVTEAVLKAFREQAPIMDYLHETRRNR